MKLLVASWLSVAALCAQGPPTGPDSGMANLAVGPDGEVYLSWIDPVGKDSHALRYAKWQGGSWSAAATITQGSRWFVNWADFPALAVGANGDLKAHWLTRHPTATSYGYGIRIAAKPKSSNTWTEIHGISLDEAKEYAGFLAFAPQAKGAIYLAPPREKGSEHRKTVRFVSFGAEGKAVEDVELDADACSCCQTAVAQTKRGLIAAYRDHQPGEIRDIAIVRERNGKWSKPEAIHADGWKINGCPTDGPSISSTEDHVAIAWLTRANDSAQVRLKMSNTAGESFGEMIRLDEGNPLGRPTLASLGDQGVVAVWLEKRGAERVEIRLRRLDWNGTLQPSHKIADAPLGRVVGFPRVAVAGNQILVAWRDGGIRTAVIPR
jgi:hypothetical protein